MAKACAVTGHRPSRFKFKYKEDYSLCKKIKRAMTEQFARLHDVYGVVRFYIGGTLGVDIWAGEIILRLKETPGYDDIELIVVIPFPGHETKWDDRSKKRLAFLLRHCSGKLTAGEQDCRQSYLQRNCYMVNNADFLLAVYDDESDPQSGTMQFVDYAIKNDKAVIYIHPDTASVKDMNL